MIFTLNALVNSIAGVIKAGFPSTAVYGSATQQGAKYPCFFVQEMPSYIHPEMDDRNRREIALDVVYVQQRNIPNAREDLREVVDYLDENLETFTYTDPAGATCTLWAYGREWSYEDQELHYKMTVKVMTSRETDVILMQVLEGENAEVKEGTEDQN